MSGYCRSSEADKKIKEYSVAQILHGQGIYNNTVFTTLITTNMFLTYRTNSLILLNLTSAAQ